VIALVWLRESEPSFQGTKLSEWVLSYQPGPGAPFSEGARVAIGHIGTNALPFLLRWIQYEPRAWRKVWERFSLPFFEDGSRRAEGAVAAFRVLGPRGSGAIPELVRLMNGTNEQIGFMAGRALGGIGKEAIPVLLDLLTNRPVRGGPRSFTKAPGDYYRSIKTTQGFQLADAWMELGTNTRFAVPALIRELTNRDESIAAMAAGLLAIETVPATNYAVPIPGGTAWVPTGTWRLTVYGEPDDVARQAVGFLVKAMNDPDSSVREEATNALRKIAPEVLETNKMR
jgi:hypothetical protein